MIANDDAQHHAHTPPQPFMAIAPCLRSICAHHGAPRSPTPSQMLTTMPLTLVFSSIDAHPLPPIFDDTHHMHPTPLAVTPTHPTPSVFIYTNPMPSVFANAHTPPPPPPPPPHASHAPHFQQRHPRTGVFVDPHPSPPVFNDTHP
ncbi:hypothetical protein BDN71DRAFT_1512569 [Pleurotus eryngii]|uniref:Uncharacterized protein n=1 Tax=Pleurotus eryngii TaxID=5323 RepID=A0A9P6D2V7_PLEER|nr:hypothetical protein BDN71DRAFT_1512569 [Pleurotus eryngii]